MYVVFVYGVDQAKQRVLGSLRDCLKEIISEFICKIPGHRISPDNIIVKFPIDAYEGNRDEGIVVKIFGISHMRRQISHDKSQDLIVKIRQEIKDLFPKNKLIVCSIVSENTEMGFTTSLFADDRDIEEVN